MRERCQKLGAGVPVLCSCSALAALQGGEDGDADRFVAEVPSWEQCANNCIFRDNPEVYGRALKGIWRSLQQE